MQAGWEQTTSNVMTGLSGLNMVYEVAGMHAHPLGFCLEALLLGDDLLWQTTHFVHSIEVTEDTVNTEVIRQNCMGGPGHFSDQNKRFP